MSNTSDQAPEQIPADPPVGDPRSASANADSTRDTRFFGQPLALANVFGVEMWERFSFYGMQGILLIYMYFSVTEGGLGIDRVVATGIVAVGYLFNALLA